MDVDVASLVKSVVGSDSLARLRSSNVVRLIRRPFRDAIEHRISNPDVCLCELTDRFEITISDADVEKFASYSDDYLVDTLVDRRRFSVAKSMLNEGVSSLDSGNLNEFFSHLKSASDAERDLNSTGIELSNMLDIRSQCKERYLSIKSGSMPSILTPWAFLNESILGLIHPSSTLLLARPFIGKTFFALLVALCAAKEQGRRVLLISPEMSRVFIGERMFGLDTDCSIREITRGALTHFTEERYLEYLDRGEDQFGYRLPYIIDNVQDMTAERMEMAIEMVEPELVVWDAMYLLKIGKGNRYDRMIEIVEWMIDTQKRYDITAFGSSMLNAQSTAAMTDVVNWDMDTLLRIEADDDMKADHRLRVHIDKARITGIPERTYFEVQWDFHTMVWNEIPHTGGEYTDTDYTETPFD